MAWFLLISCRTVAPNELQHISVSWSFVRLSLPSSQCFLTFKCKSKCIKITRWSILRVKYCIKKNKFSLLPVAISFLYLNVHPKIKNDDKGMIFYASCNYWFYDDVISIVWRLAFLFKRRRRRREQVHNDQLDSHK